MAKPVRGSQRSKRRTSGLPLIVFVVLITGFLLAWLAGEALLYARPHPLHWAVAVGGGFVGWLIGKVVYRVRGDIA